LEKAAEFYKSINLGMKHKLYEMRHKAIIILILLGLLPNQLWAQAEKTDDSGTFSFYFENDTFLL
jgi:hypothetical protein